MTEQTLFSGLAVAHIWQSVAVAAVLALALVSGRKLSGATRYWLAGAAFIACLALPLASFIPGESLVRWALKTIDAPVSVKTEQQMAAEKAAQKTAEAKPADALPAIEKAAIDAGVPAWVAKVGSRAVNAGLAESAPVAAGAPAVPHKPNFIEKAARDGGAPDWAARIGGAILTPETAASASAAQVAPPKPAFQMPDVKMPDLSFLALPLLLVWVAGSVLMLVRTARDLMAVERLTSRAKPVKLPEALRERMPGVRVAVSAEAPGPMAAGLFRPVVVLPENATAQLTTPGMAALLEHERAHIERRDMMVALIQRVILALLWWSPALHWISRRIDEERELACDETAVERTGDARAFARSLTTQAENQLWARAPRLAVGAIGPRSQFGRRIRRLIDIAKSGASPAKYSGRLAFSGLALTVAFAALVTPRMIADAKTLPPAQPAPAAKPSLLAQLAQIAPSAQPREDVKFNDRKRNDRLAGAPRGEHDGVDIDPDSLGGDLAVLMQGVADDLRYSINDIPPGKDSKDGDFAGLSSDFANLGAEIGAQVSEQIAQQMPEIMDQVRQAMEEAKAAGWSDADREQMRKQMEQLRQDLRTQLGPEFREKIRRQVEDARREAEKARAEVEKHRGGWEAQAAQGRAAAEIARQAAEQARKAVEEARIRGDFDFHFDFDKFDSKWKGFDRRSSNDDTPAEKLLRAASRGDEDRVLELLKAGADPNAVVRGDGTALIAAARRGEEDVVRVLLDHGADPNKASPGDGNPLIQAALHGHEDVVKQLLARGANANAYVEGDETPLINAARAGDEDIVRMLVEKGADVNRAYRVKTGLAGGASETVRSPLSMALRYGHTDIADYLRKHGAVENPKPAN